VCGEDLGEAGIGGSVDRNHFPIVVGIVVHLATRLGLVHGG
jgi:hypothetical protein